MEYCSELNTIMNFNGDTLLNLATKEGSISKVKELLSTGTLVNLQEPFKDAAIHIAVKQNYIKMVCFLISEGADVNANDFHNNTPLHYAARYNNLNIVNILLQNGARVDAKNRVHQLTPLHEVIINNVTTDRLEIANLLIQNSANLNLRNFHGETFLHYCAEYGKFGVEIGKTILEKGADVNVKTPDGNTPLHLATRMGPLETVNFFIQNGADVDAQNNLFHTPLHELIVTSPSSSPSFSYSNLKIDLNIARLLINSGLNLELKTRKFETYLHLCAKHKVLGLHLAKILIEKGINVNTTNIYNQTPLLYVLLYFDPLYSIDLIDVFHEGGANLNLQDNFGNTVLHIAVMRGYTEAVKKLLELGSDINVKNNNNYPPYKYYYLTTPEMENIFLKHVFRLKQRATQKLYELMENKLPVLVVQEIVSYLQIDEFEYLTK